MPCTPEELDELAGLIADGHLGKTEVKDMPLEDQFETKRTDPAATWTAKALAGFFPHWRTARGGLGELISASVLDPLFIGVNKANKIISDAHKELNGIFGKVDDPSLGGKVRRRLLGISSQLDEKLRTGLEASDVNGDVIGTARSQFSSNELSAVKEIKSLLNRVGEKTGVSFEAFQYLRNNKVDRATLKEALPQYAATAQYLNRRAQFRDPNEKLAGLVSEYLNASVSSGIKKPLTDQLTGQLKTILFGDGVNVKGVVVASKPEMQIWRGVVADVLGRPTPLDVKFMQGVDSMYKYFFPNGTPPGMAGLYKYSTIMSDLAVAGTMGGRPASVIRQLTQLIPMWAEFGGKYSRQAMAEVLNDIRGPRVMRENYAERGLMSSTFERLDQSIETSGKAGKSISAVSETLMKAFGATDAFVRIVTARASELRFNEFLSKDALEKLPGKQEVRDEVLKAYRNGQTEIARDKYIANNLATLQYDFSRTNRPEFSRGAISRLATMFLSYPLNTAEMLASFSKRAFTGAKTGNYGEMLPMVRLMGATYAAGMVGSEFLDADVSSALVYGAIPHTTFFPKAAIDGFNVGRSSVEWSFGKIFNTGETQYAQNFRNHAFNSIENFATSMIPGWNAVQDVSKLIDEGSFARMLALTPKGPELDRLARERQKAERLAQ